MSDGIEIAFVASGDPSIDQFQDVSSGGTGPIWRLANEFTKRGHDVTIYSGTYGQSTRWRSNGIEIVELPTLRFRGRLDWLLKKIPFSKALTRHSKLSTTPEEMLERLFGRLLFARRAAQSISLDRPDVVYLRDRISAFFAVRTAPPSVFTLSSPDACGFCYDSAASRHPVNRVLFPYKQRIEEFVLARSNEIISMNDRIRRYLIQRGFDDPTTVTLGAADRDFVDIDARQEERQA
jgi:hypothetical protein